MPADAERIAQLSRRFAAFAGGEGRLSSPLYARLARGVAEDPPLLALAAAATAHPVPNLLFGAVQYLLAQGADLDLARFYPTLTPDPETTGDPYPRFHAFCLAHADAIRAILTTRLVQTNEVRRCACLLPAFALAAGTAPGRPLALIEVGASAGLNLLWDHYAYDYGDGRMYGAAGSPVRLHCTLRGSHRPPLPGPLPVIAARQGLDLHPVDLTDPDAVAWLRALIWPEHRARLALLDAAVAVARQARPPVLAGDALDLLPSLLAAAPDAALLCVYHTFTLNQFTPDGRAAFDALLRAASARRPIVRIAIEHRQGEFADVALTVYRAGAAVERTLAYCNPHGEWMEWLDAGTPSPIPAEARL